MARSVEAVEAPGFLIDETMSEDEEETTSEDEEDNALIERPPGKERAALGTFLCDKAQSALLFLVTAGGFVVIGAIAFAALVYCTTQWYPPPPSQSHQNYTGNSRFGGLFHTMCGISDIDPSVSNISDQLLLDDIWIFNDLEVADEHERREVDRLNLSYSDECFTISRVDVVGDELGPPCTRWCQQYMGNFAYNLFCNLPTGVAPAVTTCFKANVAMYFSGINTGIKYAIVIVYALTSGLLGWARFQWLKRKNPMWMQHRKFTRSDAPAKLFFCIPITEGSKQKFLLQKLFFTVAGDILSDLLTVFAFLIAGEPFFAAFLMVFMIVLFAIEKDDVFQSSALTALAFSMEAGFPTKALLSKSVAEGCESFVSGLLSTYVVFTTPTMSLESIMIFTVSMSFSLLSFQNGLVCQAVLNVMAKNPEAEWDFDERLELTGDAVKIGTLRCCLTVAGMVNTLVTIFTARYRFQRILTLGLLGVLVNCFFAGGLLAYIIGSEFRNSGYCIWKRALEKSMLAQRLG